MIDSFAERVVTELKDVKSLFEAQHIAASILDSGDFQGNVPELKDAIYQMTSIDDVTMLMWRAASNGLEIKRRYG